MTTLGLSPVSLVWAAEPPGTNYTLFVAVSSAPHGVTLASSTDLSGETIGQTPCVIVLNLSWEKKWNGMHWRTLKVQSPGNACRAEFDKEGNVHLILDLTAAKNGFQPQRFVVQAATLESPGFFWSGREDWPLKSTVHLELQDERESMTGESAQTSTQKYRAGTVVIARDNTGADMSRILVTSNENEAEVLVDGTRVGRVPLNLVLQPGSYRLEVRKSGFASFVKVLQTTEGADEHVEAPLKPALQP
ncbi:MAG: hypothetical protein A2X46_17505 [Lentisphaerae bacterium GWF2_57_35]|nr:MAG: hypothetical protein A2X46_17505 [Lentisphaerae bacterium GWF2_57_35]